MYVFVAETLDELKSKCYALTYTKKQKNSQSLTASGIRERTLTLISPRSLTLRRIWKTTTYGLIIPTLKITTVVNQIANCGTFDDKNLLAWGKEA